MSAVTSLKVRRWRISMASVVAVDVHRGPGLLCSPPWRCRRRRPPPRRGQLVSTRGGPPRARRGRPSRRGLPGFLLLGGDDGPGDDVESSTRGVPPPCGELVELVRRCPRPGGQDLPEHERGVGLRHRVLMVDARKHRIGARQATGGELARLAVEELGVVRLHQGAPGAWAAVPRRRREVEHRRRQASIRAPPARRRGTGRCSGGRPGVPL